MDRQGEYMDELNDTEDDQSIQLEKNELEELEADLSGEFDTPSGSPSDQNRQDDDFDTTPLPLPSRKALSMIPERTENSTGISEHLGEDLNDFGDFNGSFVPGDDAEAFLAMEEEQNQRDNTGIFEADEGAQSFSIMENESNFEPSVLFQARSEELGDELEGDRRHRPFFGTVVQSPHDSQRPASVQTFASTAANTLIDDLGSDSDEGTIVKSNDNSLRITTADSSFSGFDPFQNYGNPFSSGIPEPTSKNLDRGDEIFGGLPSVSKNLVHLESSPRNSIDSHRSSSAPSLILDRNDERETNKLQNDENRKTDSSHSMTPTRKTHQQKMQELQELIDKTNILLNSSNRHRQSAAVNKPRRDNVEPDAAQASRLSPNLTSEKKSGISPKSLSGNEERFSPTLDQLDNSSVTQSSMIQDMINNARTSTDAPTPRASSGTFTRKSEENNGAAPKRYPKPLQSVENTVTFSATDSRNSPKRQSRMKSPEIIVESPQIAVTESSNSSPQLPCSLEADKKRLLFGRVRIGTESTRRFRLLNSGEKGLWLKVYFKKNAPGFKIVAPEPRKSTENKDHFWLRIRANEIKSFEVQFCPPSRGAVKDKLMFGVKETPYSFCLPLFAEGHRGEGSSAK